MSSAEPIYASRILKLPLVTPDGDSIGRVDDLLIGPPTGGAAPILLGLVAQVGRRRIFLSGSRVQHFETSGVVLTSAALDLRPFKPRTGELLLSSLLDRPLHRRLQAEPTAPSLLRSRAVLPRKPASILRAYQAPARMAA